MKHLLFSAQQFCSTFVPKETENYFRCNEGTTCWFCSPDRSNISLESRGREQWKTYLNPYRINPNNIINSAHPHQNTIFNLFHPGNPFISLLKSLRAWWLLLWLRGLRCTLCFWYWKFRSTLICALSRAFHFAIPLFLLYQCLQSSTAKNSEL